MRTDHSTKKAGQDFHILRALILFPVCLLCAVPGMIIVYFGYPNDWLLYVGYFVALIGLAYGPLLLQGKRWTPQYPMKRILSGESVVGPTRTESSDIPRTTGP